MSEEPIPVAVIGAGNMGRNHIRVFTQVPAAELVAVVEPDPSRAADVADTYDIPVVDSVSELSGVAAASIAVPNELHQQIALECIDQGLDILVEKPLAPTVAAAEAIVAAARANDCLLQVGHIERFNPAIDVLTEVLSNQTIIALEAHRLGPFEDHLSGENVVLDLMIHDLDVVQALVDSPVDEIQAMGVKQHSSTYDYVVAIISFANGAIATLTASHITHGKIRNLSVTTADAYTTVDYQQQDVEIQQKGMSQETQEFSLGGMRKSTATVQPYVQTQEPLQLELEHFLSCVRTRDEPRVTGDDGVRAVKHTQRIIDQLER